MAVTRVDMSGPDVDVTFSDGSRFRFHALWLRDACPDGNHLQPSLERNVEAIPYIAKRTAKRSTGAEWRFEPSAAEIDREDGSLTFKWDPADAVDTSTFDPKVLRAYAELVAMPLETAAQTAASIAASPEAWLSPYTGMANAPAPDPATLHLFKNSETGLFKPPVVQFDDLPYGRSPQPGAHEDLLRKLVDPGCVIIDNVPDDAACDGSVLASFAQDYLGGLQKHPLRDNAHWTISTEESIVDKSLVFRPPAGGEDGKKGHKATGSSTSYNTDLQIANHTDQSVYGTPGIFLAFHCALGEGNNSLTDGFAVAYAMRERYPKSYEMLSKYGMDAGRHLNYYAKGAFSFDTCSPILHTDEQGNLKRVQYHEIYRTPLTVPYKDFPAYYNALETWYSMLHSEEFMSTIQLRKGQMIFFNNWRVMHGRAGLKGKKRVILGGTVTRDAYYSSARYVLQQKYGLTHRQQIGLPVHLFHKVNGVGDGDAAA